MAPYYDFLVSPTAERECRFLDDVFQVFGKGRVKRILDLGCGTGRHSRILSRMGYEVTGIDLSEEMLKVGRLKCPKVKFIKMNFLKMDLEANLFDASICMWTTIGYILKEKDFKVFVDNVGTVTKHLFVIDSSNYENLTKSRISQKGKRELKLPNLTIKSRYIRNFDKNTRVREETYYYEISRGSKRSKFVDRNRLRMWRLEEVADLLKPNFKIIKVFGDYSLDNEFSKTKSDRKIIVAAKYNFHSFHLQF